MTHGMGVEVISSYLPLNVSPERIMRMAEAVSSLFVTPKNAKPRCVLCYAQAQHGFLHLQYVYCTP
jgi:hypothetical protein